MRLQNTADEVAKVFSMKSVTHTQFFVSGSFLYSVGDAENLNKGTICRTIRRVCLELKSVNIFITSPGHRRTFHIKEVYKIAGNLNFNLQPL